MRSLNSPAAALATAVGIAAACSDGAGTTAAKEIAAVDRSIALLAEAPPEDRGIRLDELRELSLSTPEVIEARDLCVSAYDSFSRAKATLERAKRDVADVERALGALERGDAGRAAERGGEIAEMHLKALESTGDVDEELDRAEELVRKCFSLRDDLRSRLGAPARKE